MSTSNGSSNSSPKALAAASTRGAHFTLYVHGGPNPWKVLIIMYELGFTSKDITFVSVGSQDGECKKPPYTHLNPNGRMPTLVDHENNDFVIWESGAIILYLIEKYDTQKKISFDKFEDEAIAKQWLMFQMSGQGPYWGQAVWFIKYHSEPVPSAAKRYKDELQRTITVLDTALSSSRYLVSNEKLSYADLSFYAWFSIMDIFGDSIEEGFSQTWKKANPNVARWVGEMAERESAKLVAEKRTEVLAKK